MFTKIVFLTIFIASLDDFAVSGNPQLGNGIAPLPTNLFPGVNFDQLPQLPSLDSKPAPANATACTCAVFMSGQFKKGSTDQPSGFPALIADSDQAFPCNPMGMKSCINKCLESIIKHLPNSEAIICGTINRDCHKERAHLFVKNCEPHWVNSNLSAGREYCCKNNSPYACPLM